MAELVGGIYYQVTLDTQQLINGQRQVDTALARATKSYDQVTDAQDRQSRSAGTLATRLTQIALAVSSLAAATYLIAQSDAYTKLNAQLKLATKSEEDFVKAREATIRISKDAQADLQSMGTLYARISKATQEMGASQKRVADITEVVALSLKVSGATGEESASAMLQLSQSFAAGVLRGEEFNAVADAAPRFLQALAEGLKVPQGQLRTMANEGKLTSDILANVLPQALGKLREEAKSVQTISGAFTNLRSEVMLFVGQQMEASGASKLVASSIATLAENVSHLGDHMGTFLAAAQAGAVLFAGTMAGRFYTSIAKSTSELLTNVEATRAAAAAEVIRAKAQQTVAYEAASVAAGARAAALATADQAVANVAAARSEVALAAAEAARAEAAALAAAGTLTAAGTAQVAAAASTRLTVAKAAEIEASAALVVAEEALAVARTQGAAAAATATASTAALTAAQRAQASASYIAAAASRAFTSVMAALGGPVGIAVIGLAALALNWDKIANSAKTAAQISEESAARIQKALGRTSDAPMRQLMAERDRAAAEIEKLDKEMKAYEDWAKSGKGTWNKEGVEVDTSDLTAQREAWRGALLEVEKAIDDFKAKQLKDLFPEPDAPLKKPAPTKEFLTKAAEAKIYYDQLVADNATALAKIDAEERKALDDNTKRQIENAANAGTYQKARGEITKKYDRERRLLEEKSTRETADFNIATIVDETERIAAIRDEDLRRADADVKLNVKTAAEGRLARDAALLNASRSFAEVSERDARARADAEIAITKDQERQIELIRDEAIRQAQDGYERGKISFDEAERDKTRALQQAEDARKALSNQRDSTVITTLQYRASSGGTQDQENLIRAQAAAAQKAVEEARLHDLQASQIYADQKVAIEEDMNRRIAEMRASANMAALGATSDAFGAILNVMQKAGQEQSGVFKVIFAAQKAFSIAQSIIAIQTGIANASSLPFPANLAAMASVISATASIVSTIRSTSYGGGRQYGGPTDAGKLYRVNETGQPEMFTASNGNQYMLGGQRGHVTSADDIGGTALPPIVNIYNAPNGGTARTSVGSDGRQIVDVFLAAVADDMASGGKVARATQSRFNLRG